MSVRVKRISSASEKVITANGVYFVNMRHNGYTNNGVHKLDCTVIRVNEKFEPHGNWIVSSYDLYANNYENAAHIVDEIEYNMRSKGLL